MKNHYINLKIKIYNLINMKVIIYYKTFLIFNKIIK
jgi:hypothetical protein